MADLLRMIWLGLRLAGVPAYIAWGLLAGAIYLARFRTKKDLAFCIMLISWHFALLAAVNGFVYSFDMLGPPRASWIIEEIVGALGSMVPSVLLTIPALWFTLDGEGIRFGRGIKIACVSVLVGLADILFAAWAVSHLVVRARW